MTDSKELYGIQFCSLSAETVFTEKLREVKEPVQEGKQYHCQQCGALMIGVTTDEVVYCSLPCSRAGLDERYQKGKRKWGDQIDGIFKKSTFYMGEVDLE